MQAECDEWISIVRCLLTEVGVNIPVIDSVIPTPPVVKVLY